MIARRFNFRLAIGRCRQIHTTSRSPASSSSILASRNFGSHIIFWSRLVRVWTGRRNAAVHNHQRQPGRSRGRAGAALAKGNRESQRGGIVSVTEIKPVVCEHCGHVETPRRRWLNASYANYLIAMDRKSGNDFPWVHVIKDFRQEPLASRGDFAKLRFWGLIEQKQNEDATKTCSGYWRLAPAGRSFVREGSRAVAWKIFQFGRPVQDSALEITIAQALGRPFDFQETIAA
jgi:hypothetical protein